MATKEFEERVLNHLLPEFSNDPKRAYGTAGFRPNFDKLSDVDAEDFLKGLDAGLVTLVGNLYRAPMSTAGEQFFWEFEKSVTPRPFTLWIEPIITVAALARLHFKMGWPKDLLGTQSVDDAFDVTTFLGPDDRSEYIAGEVKKTEREAERLIDLMRAFGSLAPDDAVSGSGKNAYRKLKALRARHAPLFWVVGPGGYGRLFKVTYSGDWVVEFEEAPLARLAYPASVTASS